MRSFTGLAASIAACFSLTTASPRSASLYTRDDLQIVNTTSGALRGVKSPYRDSITVFKGIPFAAPPTGQNRWTAPKSPSAWNGIYNATEFGPQCAQTTSGSAGIFNTASTTWSEDCLTLNVWTPPTSTSEKVHPVFVWIYGGRFTGGSGDVLTYDGSGLASKGVVVVTLNYRLGPFGFLAHPELSAESGHNASGNYGIMDQQFALQWVQDNIESFGGNKSQVVVGGQSAGSASALDMMWSPLTPKGSIKGVIAESGARGPHDPLTGSLATSYRTKTRAESQGRDFLESMNVSTIAELRNVTATTLLTADGDSDEIFEGTAFENITAAFMDPPLWRPVIDGYVLTHGYGAALATNSHADVPIMTGNNHDESGATPDPDLTVTDYKTYGQMFRNFSSKFYSLYPGNNATQADAGSNDFFRDLSRVSTWNWATDWAAGGAQSNVYVYFFNRAPAENKASGAYHGSELWYTFNNIPYSDYSNVTWEAYDYEVERQMSEYWVNFISTGNPNGGNLTCFPPTTAEDKQVMYLGNSWGAGVLTPSEEQFDFIQSWMSTLFRW